MSSHLMSYLTDDFWDTFDDGSVLVVEHIENAIQIINDLIDAAKTAGEISGDRGYAQESIDSFKRDIKMLETVLSHFSI